MAASYPTSIKTFPTRSNGNTITPGFFNDPDDEITAIETALLQGTAHNLKAPGFRFDNAAAKTIASGVITITSGYLTVDTEGAAASDDLDTITIGVMSDGVAIGEGSVIILQSVSAARVITVRDTVGNIRLQGNFTFASTDDRLTLLYNGSAWVEIARAYGQSSTYTPTLTNVTNIDGSTAYVCQWMRVGNVVTVSGRVDINTTAGATGTELGISLPVPSNLSGGAGGSQCSGTAAAPGVVSYSAAILGDGTNDRASLQFVNGADVSNLGWFFTFTYVVI